MVKRKNQTKKGGGNKYTELDLIEENGGGSHYNYEIVDDLYLSSDGKHFIRCTYDRNKHEFISLDGDIAVHLLDTPDFSQYKVYTLGSKRSKSRSKPRSKSRSKPRSKSGYGTRV
jgi:hypothetical protein